MRSGLVPFCKKHLRYVPICLEVPSGRVSMALDKFSKKVLFLLSTCPSYDRPLFVIITS